MTNRIEYIHSQRVGNKRMPVTAYGEDASKCYKWSIQGSKQPRKDGVKMVYYVCSGCRSVRLQELVPKSRILPTRKADATTDMWIDLEPNNEHFCEPRNLSAIQRQGLTKDYEKSKNFQEIVRMIGALQLTPTLVYRHASLLIIDLIKENFGEDTAVFEKLNNLLEYYRKTWMDLGDFFTLHGMSGPKTTNAAESYHGKQRHHFRMRCKLGEWVVSFRELQNSEEENASDVRHGRQPPRKQSQTSKWASEQIAAAQEEFDQFLAGERKNQQVKNMLKVSLLHIGQLMGYNRPLPADDEEDEEPSSESEHEENKKVNEDAENNVVVET